MRATGRLWVLVAFLVTVDSGVICIPTLAIEFDPRCGGVVEVRIGDGGRESTFVRVVTSARREQVSPAGDPIIVHIGDIRWHTFLRANTGPALRCDGHVVPHALVLWDLAVGVTVVLTPGHTLCLSPGALDPLATCTQTLPVAARVAGRMARGGSVCIPVGGSAWDTMVLSGSTTTTMRAHTGEGLSLACVSVRVVSALSSICLVHRVLGCPLAPSGMFPLLLICAFGLGEPRIATLRLLASGALRLWWVKDRGNHTRNLYGEDVTCLTLGTLVGAALCPNAMGDVVTLLMLAFFSVWAATRISPSISHAMHSRTIGSVAELVDVSVGPTVFAITFGTPALEGLILGIPYANQLIVVAVLVAAPLSVTK